MRYFCTHPPLPLLILFFSLAFLTLSLSLNTTQVEVLKKISGPFSWDLHSDPCQWYGITCSKNGGDDIVGLDLSSSEIDDRIWHYVCQLPSLQFLNLSDNLLQGQIPDCLRNFPNLTNLRLSNNRFSEFIPPRLGSLSNLRVLDLSDNQMKDFNPSKLTSLSNLRVLDLSYNQMKDFNPSKLTSLSNLRVLDLNNNELTGFIPPQLLSLSSLENLDLSFNHLSGEIPHNFSKNLLWLSMENNNLTGNIPSAISNARNLTHLIMSNNFLNGPIPGKLSSCTQLKSLRLENNKLQGPLNHVLPKLLQLTNLSLSNNMFEGSILDELSNLSNLTFVDLSGNLLSGNISSKIFNLKRLTTLYLEENYLTGIIPLNIQNAKLLQKLKLGRNNLTGTIPLGIGNLYSEQYPEQELGVLSLSHNSLTGKIPETLGNMNQPSELDLSNNKLTGEIPQSLGNIHIYRLNLSNNNLIGEIPESIGNMSRSAWLDLSNNKLTGEIPELLGNMRGLDQLDLSNNKLTGEIPEALGNLSELERLDLSNNKLTGEIPESLANIQLYLLNLSNNKLRGKIPESLGNRTLDGNLSYLDSLDLSNNKLTGKIPESLKRIRHVNLSNNELIDITPAGRSHSTFKILGVVGAVVVFIICCLVVGVVWKRNLHSRAELKQTILKILQKVEHPRISHEELLAATNRFHNSNLLSTNSFGSVYKGFLPDGTRVAVKVLNLMHDQSEKIFRAECRVLQKARHRNLARIITTCSTPHFKALVFQYFSHGSLDKHLYLDRCRLGLRKLLNIATDVAHAMEYLHYDCFVQIVHCDIKPSNVLLDESMTAHLSDYGISRLIGRIAGSSVTSTIDLKGSVGYIAPEYGLNGMISPRGDVYSYGILLLEMLTRRRPTDNMFDGDLNLHNWVKRAFPDRAFEVIDNSLLMERAGKETEECLISLMRLGLLCSTTSPEARPSMREVSNLMKLIQQDFATDASSSIKLMPTISNLVCDRAAITNFEEASYTQSSSF